MRCRGWFAPLSFHEPSPRRTPNAQHRTPNVEGRLREPLGVRRSVLDVRCSSPGRFMAPIHVRILEVFPTHEFHAPLNLEPLNLEPLNLEPLNLEPLNLEPLNLEPLNLEPRTSNGRCRARSSSRFKVRGRQRLEATHEPSPRRTPNAQRRTPNIEGSLRELSGIRCSAFGVGCSVFVPCPVHGLDSRPIFGGVPSP